MTERAVIVDNDMNMDMFHDLQSNPEQSEAKPLPPSMSFLDKVLHPPSSVPGFVGLPTNDARSQVLAEYRNIITMLNPSVLLDDGPETRVVNLSTADLASFNVAYLVTNGGRVLSIAYIYDTTTGLWYQDLANTDLQDVYEFANWRQDAQLYRPAYKSLTTYLNATAFNNTGSVAVSSFNPAILFAGSLVTLSHDDPILFKDYILTMHEAGKLYYPPGHKEFTKGIVNFLAFSLQGRDDLTRILGSNNRSDISVRLDPGTTVQILSLGDIGNVGGGSGGTIATIPSNSMILNQSQRSYAGRAMEGTFSVSKFNTIAPRWQVATNGDQNPTTYGMYECHLVSYRQDGTRRVNVLREPSPVGTLATDVKNLVDTLWTPDMTMTWIRYEGLAFNPSQVQNQLVIRKYYTGLEIQPALKSAWAGMQKSGPPPDLKAMQAIMDGFYTLKDGMPAKFNFLGTLGSIAASGLKTFGANLLSKLVSSKEPESMKPSEPAAAVTVKTQKSNNREKDLEKQIAALNKKLNNMTVSGSNGNKRQRPRGPPKPQARGRPAWANEVYAPPANTQPLPPAKSGRRRRRNNKRRGPPKAAPVGQ